MNSMKRRLDTILLAAGLFTLSGAILCYNLATLGGEEIEAAVRASAKPSGSYLSEAAMAALESDETEAAETVVGLLPPIVVPD